MCNSDLQLDVHDESHPLVHKIQYGGPAPPRNYPSSPSTFPQPAHPNSYFSSPIIPPLPFPRERSISPLGALTPEVDEPSWAPEPMDMAYATNYLGIGTPYASTYNDSAPSEYGSGPSHQFTPYIPLSADLHPTPSIGGHHASPSMGAGQQMPGWYFAAPIADYPLQISHHEDSQLSADYTIFP